jgi:hypothetical protein
MRPTATPPIARLIALAGALLAIAFLAAPVAAKEFVEARLDAPIPMGTPGGTEILVGILVSVSEPDGMHPVEGTPVYLQLIGRDGATTRAAGAADGIAGHYTFRIAIPAGGARGVEIGIAGTDDLPVMLTGDDPFTFGGITGRTAQLAPPLTPAPTPVAPAAVPVAPAAASATQPGGEPAMTGMVLAAAILSALAAVLVVAGVRRVRARRPSVARDAG